jgi:hypothetical protein
MNNRILPQNINELETKFRRLNLLLDREKLKTDSLKSLFNEQTLKIDIEKNKNAIDEDLIAEIMSSSLEIDEAINRSSKKADRLTKEIEQMKPILSSGYKSIIDSLEDKLISSSDEEKNLVENEILFYREELIYLSPISNNLSYDPKEILNIDVNKIYDDSEKKIYILYLQNALTEAADQLDGVVNKLEEINRTALLQEKAEEFIEDIQMGNDISKISPSRGGNRALSLTGVSKDYTNEMNTLTSQALVYSSILTQLNPLFIDGAETRKWTYDSLRTNLSIDSYVKLLNDVKTGLSEYKKILENKLHAE